MSLFSIFKDKLNKTSNILSLNIFEILKNKKIDDLTEATQTNSFVAKVGTTLVSTIWAGLVAYLFYLFRDQ